MNENKVKKEQLSYRTPNKDEQEQILKYMTNSVQKDTLFWLLIMIGCIWVETAFILGLLGISSTYSSREKIAVSVIAILLSILLLFINKWRISDKKFIKRIQNGDFQVVSCKVYNIDLHTKVTNGAIIYVCDADGRYCDERFLVDYLSAKEWTKNSEMSFLLMRAIRGKVYYYEMFSERKLNI